MDGGLNKDGTFAHYNTVAPKTDRVLPLFSLKGKTAIVSGAGAGIGTSAYSLASYLDANIYPGLAVAQGLAEAGANVAIWYYSNKKALDRAAEIEKNFGVTCVFRDRAEYCYSKAYTPTRQGVPS